MTVTSENRISGPFVGPGPTFTWTIFEIFADSELEVIETSPEDVNTVKVLTSDYTVNRATKQITAVGTWAADLTANHKVTLKGKLPLTQLEDPTNQGPLDPQQHEDAWDRAVIIDQQQQEELDRCYQVDVGEAKDADALVADRYNNRPKLLAQHVVPFTGPAVIFLEAVVVDTEIYDSLLFDFPLIWTLGGALGRSLGLQLRVGAAYPAALNSYAFRSLDSLNVAATIVNEAQNSVQMSITGDFNRGATWASGRMLVSSHRLLSHTGDLQLSVVDPLAAAKTSMVRGSCLVNLFTDNITGFRVFTDGVTAEMIGTVRLWGIPKN
jgi:hypothetical protein